MASLGPERRPFGGTKMSMTNVRAHFKFKTSDYNVSSKHQNMGQNPRAYIKLKSTEHVSVLGPRLNSASPEPILRLFVKKSSYYKANAKCQDTLQIQNLRL